MYVYMNTHEVIIIIIIIIMQSNGVDSYVTRYSSHFVIIRVLQSKESAYNKFKINKYQ